MSKTSNILENCIYQDLIPDDFSVLADYFGIHNLNILNIHNHEYITNIFGMYQCLIKYGNITSNDLHNALINNSLDKMIHNTFNNVLCSNSYYKEFCKYQIQLQLNINTENFDLNIPNDNDNESKQNICPNCNLENYNDYFPVKESPDCLNCYQFICTRCSEIDKDDTSARICNHCYNAQKSKKSLKQNITKKINTHKQFDKNRFGEAGDISYNDIINLLDKQNYQCYKCNDLVETINYKAYCCYQFSIDRINNFEPHNKNNIRISCYYCNCNHHPKFNQPNKVCNSKCHKVPKNI
jgi:hypothetical protein